MRMGAVAWLVACSGKSARPVLAALMSSSALLLACPCPATAIACRKMTDQEPRSPCQEPAKTEVFLCCPATISELASACTHQPQRL